MPQSPLELWQLTAQLAAILIPIALGLTRLHDNRLLLYAALTGFLMNLAVALPERNSILCIGSVAGPVMCMIIASLSRGLRLLLIKLNILHDPTPLPGPHCPQCGYSLIGLTSQTCPECGRPFSPSDFQWRNRRR